MKNKMNKKSMIIICIVSIILTIIGSISCNMYYYAKKDVEYTIEFTENTKVKTIGINTNNIPLGRFKDSQLEIDDNGLLYSKVEGKTINISASIIDDFYIAYDESDQNKEDMIVYRENEKQEIKDYEYTYLNSKFDIIRNSINGYIIPIAIIFLFVMFGLVYYLCIYYEKLKNNEIKIYNIIFAMIDLFIIFLFSYYFLFLILRKFIIIPIVLLLLYNLYIVIKMSKRNAENIYATFIVTVGVTMIFAMAPFNVPDEASHFYRAYKDSLLVGDTDDGGFWKFPKTVTDLTLKFNRNLHSSANKIYAENYISEVFKTVDYDIESSGLTNYGNVKNLSFISYVPSAIILFIGRHIGVPILVLFLLCRLADLIISMILCYYAIKLIPYFKKVLLIVALFPVFIQQSAAINMDYLTNAIILFLMSYIVYLIYKAEKVGIKEVLYLAILCIVLSLGKFGYFPVLLLLLLIPSKKFHSKKSEWLFKVLFIILTLVCSFSINIKTAYNSNVDVSQESDNVYGIKYFFTNPVDSMKIIIGTAINRIDQDIFRCFFDCFGYSTIWNEPVFYLLLCFLYFIAILVKDEDDINLTISQRILFILIPLAIIAIVYAIAFSQWTEVGKNAIYGIQARYFVATSAILYIGCSNNKINIDMKDKKVFYAVLITIAYSVIFLSISVFFS